MKIKRSSKAGAVVMQLNQNDELMLSHSVAPAPANDSLVKLKTILVPIDFSDCSKQALAAAVPFAEQFGATLSLLYVATSYYAFDPNGLGLYDQSEPAALVGGRKALEELAGNAVPPEVGTKVLVRCGRAATEIVAAAREMSADLIIISTHGYTGLKHVAFGSTAEDVVRHATCPVLTVRAKEPGKC